MLPPAPLTQDMVASRGAEERAPDSTNGSQTHSNHEAHSESLKYYLARQSSSQSYNAEMSKWILASLVLINAGPFAIATKENSDHILKILAVSHYFASGLAAAILCGFFAWVNTGMREMEFGYKADQEMTFLKNGSVNGKQNELKILDHIVKLSYAVSVVSGLASLALFLVGAFVLGASFPP